MSVFDRNAVLCGFPMPACKNVADDPMKLGSDCAIASPVILGKNPTIIVSSPSSILIFAKPTQPQNTHHSAIGKISPVAMIAIILGDILVPNKSFLLPLNWAWWMIWEKRCVNHLCDQKWWEDNKWRWSKHGPCSSITCVEHWKIFNQLDRHDQRFASAHARWVKDPVKEEWGQGTKRGRQVNILMPLYKKELVHQISLYKTECDYRNILKSGGPCTLRCWYSDKWWNRLWKKSSFIQVPGPTTVCFHFAWPSLACNL